MRTLAPIHSRASGVPGPCLAALAPSPSPESFCPYVNWLAYRGAVIATKRGSRLQAGKPGGMADLSTHCRIRPQIFFERRNRDIGMTQQCVHVGLSIVHLLQRRAARMRRARCARRSPVRCRPCWPAPPRQPPAGDAFPHPDDSRLAVSRASLCASAFHAFVTSLRLLAVQPRIVNSHPQKRGSLG